jgi:hypothetical protein
LLQAGCSKEEEGAMMREVKGGKCEFDKTVNGLRLRPISFISMRRQATLSRHSFVGKASTGRWATLKFKHHFIGREFTWITDCSGLLKFFKTDYEATHTMQRWKLELLRFDFTIVHRPAQMLTECDMLSQYNTWTEAWRNKKDDDITSKTLFSLYTQAESDTGSTTYGRWCDEKNRKETEKGTGQTKPHFTRDLYELTKTLTEETPVPVSHVSPKVIGQCFQNKTAMAEVCDRSRTIWVLDSRAQTATKAMTALGIHPTILRESKEQQVWQELTDSCNLTTLRQRIERKKGTQTGERPPEWIIIPRAHDYKTDMKKAQLEELVITGKETGAKAAIMVWTSNNRKSEESHAREIQVLAEELGKTKTGTIWNEEQGGHIEGRTTYLVAAPAAVIKELGNNEFQTEEFVGTIQDILDQDDNIFTDYFQWHEEIKDEVKPPNPRTDKAGVRSIINVIDHNGKERTIPIFDTDKPGPNITTRQQEVGERAFCIEARDGIISQAARPLRNHELLRALGFPEEDVTELTRHKENWTKIYNRLIDTVPRHSFEPLIAAVFQAEQTVAEAKIKGELNAEEGAEGETSMYGNQDKARALLTQVIKRWTTLPAPTEQTWRAATLQDPDLQKAQIGIQHYMAAPEEHNAIFCERFHRYLNKAERLGVIDHQSYEKWKMNTVFASYAWNASPIDGTNVIRSFAAKAWTFRSPLDTQGTHEEARIPQEGEQARQHLGTMFPLWYQQKELLRIINEERRNRHQELANKHKKKRTFQPGDLVIIRKQVNSQGDEGKPAKLTLRAKGPYRVLEPAGENSYYVQKIPAVQNVNRRPGKQQKELAMRMEKTPSSLVIHKRVDTIDTRLAQWEGQLAANPLEKNLGFF